MRMLEKHYEEITHLIPNRHEVQAIEVTPAAKWFYQENDQEYWEKREDFPTIMPPFTFTWSEFVMPKFSRGNGQVRRLPDYISRVGCMVCRHKVKEDMREATVLYDVAGRAMADAYSQSTGKPSPYAPRTPEMQEVIKAEVSEDGGAYWWAVWRTYVEVKGRLIELPSVATYLNRFGKPFSYEMIAGSTDMMEQLGGSNMWMLPFWFAISLMHAKNVNLENLAVPERVAKKRAKRGNPTLAFKTLQINSLRKETDSQPGTGVGGMKRALHFVRGHFKDFREHGLFGRHKEIYWWDMHARGNEGQGKVIKDYQLAEPAA